MARQLGLLSAKFTGQYEILKDAQTGLEVKYIQVGVAAGQYTTAVPGVCKLAYLQTCTDLVGIAGLRMYVQDSGVAGTEWKAMGNSALGLSGWMPAEAIIVTGTPEGAVIAPVGSTALRTDGGTSTTLYVKQSGTGNTGWVAK